MVQFMALFSLKPSNEERRMCSELGWFFFLSFASKTKKKIHLVWLNGVWSVYLVLTMTVINQQDWTKEQ